MTVLVAVHHLPAAWLGDEPGPLVAALDAFHERAAAVVSANGGRVELVSDALLVASFPDGGAAGAAFALSERGADAHAGPSVVVGIGRGPTTRAGGAMRGLEVSRALRLARIGAAGDVLCTRAVVETGLPDGIGLFRAPEAHERHAGFAVHVLVDYRG